MPTSFPLGRIGTPVPVEDSNPPNAERLSGNPSESDIGPRLGAWQVVEDEEVPPS